MKELKNERGKERKNCLHLWPRERKIIIDLFILSFVNY
jgi:hypothetical protein